MKFLRVFFLFISFLYCTTGFAQVKLLSGTVTDSLKKPVPYTSVVAYSLSSKDTVFISFTQTGTDGKFQLSCPDTTKRVWLSVSLLGYTTVWKQVELVQNVTILPEPLLLLPIAVHLNDVFVVDRKTFNELGDTLNINPNAFRDSTEKTVEDLLKKIPGFDVTEKGDIYYQGKQIHRITLDGDDIAKREYKIISKNFAANPVENIQIINNYSELPLMANIDAGNKETVLNLGINKKYKNIWNKQAEGTIGYPWLYDAYINTNMISKKLKTISYADYNTMSNNHFSSEVIIPSSINPPLLDVLLKDDWITLYHTPVDIEPVLFQKYSYLGLNTSSLYKFNSKTTLQITGNGYQKKARYTEYTDEQNLFINTFGDRTRTQNYFIPYLELNATYFPNKKQYFSYSAKYKQPRIHEFEQNNTNIFSNAIHANTQHKNIENELIYNHKAGKYTFLHKAKYQYRQQNLNYLIIQSPPQKFPFAMDKLESVSQFLNIPQQNVALESNCFVGKHKYTLLYDYTEQSFSSHIQPINATEYENVFNQDRYVLQRYFAMVERSKKWKSFSAKMEVKPGIIQWRYYAKLTVQQPNKTMFTVLPIFTLAYKRLVFSYQYQNNPMSIRDVYMGYVFRDSRNLSRGAGWILPYHQHTGTVAHLVNKYASGIIFSNSLSYVYSKGLFAPYTVLDSIYTLTQIMPQITEKNSFIFNSNFTKIFYKRSLGLGFTHFAMYNSSPNFFAGIPMQTNMFFSQSGIKFTMLPSNRVLYFDAGARLSMNYIHYTIPVFSFSTKQYAYRFTPYWNIYVKYKSLFASANIYYMWNFNNTVGQPFTTPWINMEVRPNSKSKIEYSIKCNNLLNQSRYVTNEVSTYSTSQSYVPLRGRVWLLNLSYNF